MNAAASDGDDTRMSRDTPMRFGVEIGDERAADVARGRLVDLGRVEAADVVGLEDVLGCS